MTSVTEEQQLGKRIQFIYDRNNTQLSFCICVTLTMTREFVSIESLAFECNKDLLSLNWLPVSYSVMSMLRKSPFINLRMLKKTILLPLAKLLCFLGLLGLQLAFAGFSRASALMQRGTDRAMHQPGNWEMK